MTKFLMEWIPSKLAQMQKYQIQLTDENMLLLWPLFFFDE